MHLKAEVIQYDFDSQVAIKLAKINLIMLYVCTYIYTKIFWKLKYLILYSFDCVFKNV